MSKIRGLLLALAASIMVIMPFAASAHDNENDDRGDFRASTKTEFNNVFGARDLDSLLDSKNNVQVRTGTVSAIGTNSFTLAGKDGKIYTVNTSSATISLPFNGHFALSSMKVNDRVMVKGTINGSVITATKIVDVPANQQPVKTSGSVTAVSGNTVTLQTKGGNTVSVNTAGSTVIKADGTVGTTADVQTGTSVKVKGLWDSVLNVLNAISIQLKAII